ncbi:uncharacterized protein I303_104218 [Kwoniella dejecticola CBS 10117]|uniref:Holocytochrome c-type synthase n=1 Tax=Kwoniella dejecticola CBS 10117 TaxID=1296121 RepID=A0A1A6A5Y5_9TREE|nr:cytochrome c heme-lyase [Kwoniella dejecticola CBS 10117]OBR85470.1 cytochrome c heme-lyase [Kwoniella dejecticola CBS 10117]
MWPFTSSPASASASSSSSSSSSTQTSTDPTMSGNNTPSADKCPVDHNTRSAWLAANPSASHPFHPSSSSASASGSGSSSSSSSSPSSLTLSEERVISSIPRSSKPWSTPSNDPETTGPPSSAAASSSNNSSNESRIGSTQGNGHAQPELRKDDNDKDNGKWVYPSEQQFFNAMMRKNHNPQARDMRTVVPIHNAVNEKAWEQILLWESKIEGSEKCGGPKLISFVGKPKERSPKAWAKTALGYTPPFDRHDWMIDRCGTQVRYVIDFYTGRSGSGDAASKMSFYLDVRPAVDNWEGIKTRAAGWWS